MAHDVTDFGKPLRGLGLPALQEAGGYFAAKTRHQVAWGDLLNALICPIGGRFMSRAFGSGLYDLLFEPGIADNPQLVRYLVIDAASRHCPHINIIGVIVVVDGRIISLRVSFSLSDDASVEERLVQLERGTVVRTP